MSWDVYLVIDIDKWNADGEDFWDAVAVVESHSEGGTYAAGGTDRAELNITYNYSAHYYANLNDESGLRWLDGRKASDVTPALEKAIEILGTAQTEDYWEATKGNAGYALSILLGWAKQYPEATFVVH